MNINKMVIKSYQFLNDNIGFLRIPPREICIITGCPRSGTTAMLRWLSESNQIAGFDEPKICKMSSRFMGDVYYYAALYPNRDVLGKLFKNILYKYMGHQKIIWNKTLVIKEPLSLRFTENIRKIFPDLKIIYMVRHPVNVFNSMAKRKWGCRLKNATPKDMSLEEGINMWKASVNQYIKNKNAKTYLCVHENLITNTDCESARIKEFLKIKRLNAFTVSDTAKIDLEEGVVRKILDDTKREREYFRYT